MIYFVQELYYIMIIFLQDELHEETRAQLLHVLASDQLLTADAASSRGSQHELLLHLLPALANTFRKKPCSDVIAKLVSYGLAWLKRDLLTPSEEDVDSSGQILAEVVRTVASLALNCQAPAEDIAQDAAALQSLSSPSSMDPPELSPRKGSTTPRQAVLRLTLSCLAHPHQSVKVRYEKYILKVGKKISQS